MAIWERGAGLRSFMRAVVLFVLFCFVLGSIET
jgi:hypothetical protein